MMSTCEVKIFFFGCGHQYVIICATNASSNFNGKVYHFRLSFFPFFKDGFTRT